MDIAQLSMDMAQSRIMSEVSVSVLDQSLEMLEMQTEMMTQMVSEAPSVSIQDVNPAIGGNVDVAI